jgi:imidazolonepropionase-like amidohydrolase
VDELGKNQLLVLLPAGVGLLPQTATRVNLPAELSLSGCQVALMPSQDSPAGLAAHRVQLAELVRAGMPREEVLQAVTLRPAAILGIDKRCGSIEQGKDADLIFLDGDPLHPDTEVRRVMIAGQTVWEAKE